MKMKREFLRFTVAILLIVLFVIAMEYFIRLDFSATIEWVIQSKIAFSFNVLIIGSIVGLIYSITNRYLIAGLVSVLIVFLITAINVYKFKFLGEYLFPWDFLLYKNIVNLLPVIYGEINLFAISGFLIAIAILTTVTILYYRRKKHEKVALPKVKSRILIAIICLSILSSIVFYRSIPPVRYFLGNIVHVYNQPWNQQTNYENNGFLLGFLFNAQSALILPPKGYGKDKMDEIVKRYSKIPIDQEELRKPNIIMVMNESFWDPTTLTEVKFSADPMPTVREHQVGWAFTPMFGGRTSNVEFEVLTGFTNAFLPVGSIAYQQYIQEAIPSLPNYLASMGYDTIGIHPYAKWFWNRDTIYPYLGFNHFIGIDDFDNPEYKGPYVSDQQVTDTIIEQIEKSENPTFIYAITMQNHTTYSKDRYETHDVTLSGPMTEDLTDMLMTYTQGIVDADKALAKLIEHYEQSDEPTTIVFFGDHLPFLGNDYALYRQTNYIPMGKGEEGWQLEDFKKMRSTPLVVWNNFDREISDVDTISTSFLGGLALNAAGLEITGFTHFLTNFSEEMPGFMREIKLRSDESMHKEVPAELKQYEEDYQLLQYDLLFGKKYSKEFFE